MLFFFRFNSVMIGVQGGIGLRRLTWGWLMANARNEVARRGQMLQVPAVWSLGERLPVLISLLAGLRRAWGWESVSAPLARLAVTRR